MQRRQFLTVAAATAATTLLAPSVLEATPIAASIVAYPDPPIPRASEFVVTVNGQPIYVYNAAGFRAASFSFSGRITVEITYKGHIHSHTLSPTARGIITTQRDNTLIFTLDSPAKLELQINNASSQIVDGDKLLYLFADALETNVPLPTDPTLYYFGPGRHTIAGNVLSISASDPRQGIYLAPGAILEAVINVSRKSNFRIFGRGFLRNPFTDKTRNMLQLSNCTDSSVEDIHLYDSIQHVLVINASTPELGHDILLRNVKSFHTVVNSDGVTFSGAVTRVTVEDCFIIGNDNLIVIGGGAGSDPIGPSHCIVRNTTFVKSSYAGNWCFLQGNSPPKTGGSIGPGNLVQDCDILRLNGELGLITEWWGTPNTIDNMVFERIRVQTFDGYYPNPAKTNVNMLLNLQSTDKEHKKEITLRDIHLPTHQTSQIADGQWVIHFERVIAAGKLVTADTDLKLTRPAGVITAYTA